MILHEIGEMRKSAVFNSFLNIEKILTWWGEWNPYSDLPIKKTCVKYSLVQSSHNFSGCLCYWRRTSATKQNRVPTYLTKYRENEENLIRTICFPHKITSFLYMMHILVYENRNGKIYILEEKAVYWMLVC